MKRVLFFCAVALSVALVACMTLDLQVKVLPYEADASAGVDGGQAGARRLGDFAQPTPKSFDLLTGAITDGGSATVTIAAGQYVTGVGAYSSTGGSVTITRSCADAASPTATIPAGIAWGLPQAMLVGGLYCLGPGTVLVFSATDSYTITKTSF